MFTEMRRRQSGRVFLYYDGGRVGIWNNKFEYLLQEYVKWYKLYTVGYTNKYVR